MTAPSTTTTALVFAAGDPPPDLAPYLVDTEVTDIVCADAGLAHCLNAGLTPQWLIGDFDSLDENLLSGPELAGTRRLEHPVDKDASDLELCLDMLSTTAPLPDQVILLGISGGRTDHHLFNWLLPAQQAWPFSLRLLDDQVDAVVTSPRMAYTSPCQPGDIVSLLPLGEVSGVTTTGLRFALNDATLRAGSTLGLSNVATGGALQVTVGLGCLLVMRVRG